MIDLRRVLELFFLWANASSSHESIVVLYLYFSLRWGAPAAASGDC